MMTTSHLAKELLNLESRAANSGWTLETQQRWLVLVKNFIEFTKVAGEKRRNIRLPTEVKVLINSQFGDAEGNLINISHTGARLVLHHQTSICVDDLVYVYMPIESNYGIGCRVSNVGSTLDRHKVLGLEFDQINADDRRQFMASVYYPAYVFYLRQLSFTGES